MSTDSSADSTSAAPFNDGSADASPVIQYLGSYVGKLVEFHTALFAMYFTENYPEGLTGTLLAPSFVQNILKFMPTSLD